AGTITAKSGTLLLSGTVASGPSFTIASASASDLKFTNTSTRSEERRVGNANRTLEIGWGGNLTISVAESITNGTILMSGGTLADFIAAGVRVGSAAILGGSGTVSSNLAGAGTITAKSGTLLLSGTVASGPSFTIASASASDLKFTNTST